MPSLEGVSSKEAPNLLGYGNVAREVRDGTADQSENPLVYPSGFFLLRAGWERLPEQSSRRVIL